VTATQLAAIELHLRYNTVL